jgi:hypothetical protein
MKANELRIGNIIQRKLISSYVGEHTPMVLTVRGTTKGGICIVDDGFVVCESEYEGIPLTEEWLVKFGCVRGHKKNYYWRSHLLFELFNITSLDNGFKIIAGRLTKGCILCISEEIQYVHQLQNLYYALTGAELALNPS